MVGHALQRGNLISGSRAVFGAIQQAGPRVSVLMAVYNGERFLREAVDSILNQTFRDFEFIIINDGSTDGTEQILRDYVRKDARIRLVSRENRGLTKSLNEGLALARGEFVARMDADDVALPKRIEVQVEMLRQDPRLVVCGCQTIAIDADGKLDNVLEYPTGTHDVKWQLLYRSTISHPGAVLRRDAMLQVGGYDESHALAQDYDLWWRLLRCGRFANHGGVLLHYRWHNGNISLSRTSSQLECAETIVRQALMRHGLVDLESKAASILQILRDQAPLTSMDIREFVRSQQRFFEALIGTDAPHQSELEMAWRSVARDWLSRARSTSAWRERLAWWKATFLWLAADWRMLARGLTRYVSVRTRITHDAYRRLC